MGSRGGVAAAVLQRDNQPWRPAETARIDWQQDGAPQAAAFGDIYYSRGDGLAESRYTFIDGNRIAERLQDHDRAEFTVGETGFGTGLNFLLTWDAWRNAPAGRPRLNYLSIERFPLRAQDL